MVAAIMSEEPTGSIWSSFSRRGAWTGTAWGGVVKKKRMMAAERPPMGRLM
jgi:hypothetical protein